MLQALRNWRQLRQNPIYLREKGHYGEPNLYYQNINRYMPFIILAVMGIGFCCGVNSLSTLFGLGDSNAALVLAACLPNILLQIISWAVVILVPALTAPMVSSEKRIGTWEILRLTHFSTAEILLSKLLGGLARLKIWKPLLIVNGIQAVMMLITVFSSLADLVPQEAIITLANPAVILRPWIEIIWIALTGLVFSTIMSTGRAALVATYAVTIGFKFLNGWLLWVLVAVFVESFFSRTYILALILSFGPVIGYLILAGATAWLLSRRIAFLDQTPEFIPV